MTWKSIYHHYASNPNPLRTDASPEGLNDIKQSIAIKSHQANITSASCARVAKFCFANMITSPIRKAGESSIRAV